MYIPCTHWLINFSHKNSYCSICMKKYNTWLLASVWSSNLIYSNCDIHFWAYRWLFWCWMYGFGHLLPLLLARFCPWCIGLWVLFNCAKMCAKLGRIQYPAHDQQLGSIGIMIILTFCGFGGLFWGIGTKEIGWKYFCSLYLWYINNVGYSNLGFCAYTLSTPLLQKSVLRCFWPNWTSLENVN